MNKNIEINVPFWIEKGNRKTRWKVIEHPYFDAFALVKDHVHLYEGNLFIKEDIKHIVCGNKTIEGVWQQAYDHS